MSAIEAFAPKIGCSAQTLIEWIKHAEIDAGRRCGIPTEPAEKMKALGRKDRELRQANEIVLKARFSCPPLSEGKHSPAGS